MHLLTAVSQLRFSLGVGLFVVWLVLVASSARADGPAEILDLDMSQTQFCQLSAREIDSLAGNAQNRDRFTVEGFSPRFARASLTLMMKSQRGRTCRLIRDMSRLTSNSDRRARLDQEIRWAIDLRNNLRNSLSRLKGKQRTTAIGLAIGSESERLAKILNFLGGLNAWRASLREGSR